MQAPGAKAATAEVVADPVAVAAEIVDHVVVHAVRQLNRYRVVGEQGERVLSLLRFRWAFAFADRRGAGRIVVATVGRE